MSRTTKLVLTALVMAILAIPTLLSSAVTPKAIEAKGKQIVMIVANEAPSVATGTTLSSVPVDEGFTPDWTPAGARVTDAVADLDTNVLTVNGYFERPNATMDICRVPFWKITDQIPGLKGQRIDWTDVGCFSTPTGTNTFKVEFKIDRDDNGMPFCKQYDIGWLSEQQLKDSESEIYDRFDKDLVWFHWKKIFIAAVHFPIGTCTFGERTTPTAGTATPTQRAETPTPTPVTPSPTKVMTATATITPGRLIVYKAYFPLVSKAAPPPTRTPTATNTPNGQCIYVRSTSHVNHIGADGSSYAMVIKKGEVVDLAAETTGGAVVNWTTTEGELTTAGNTATIKFDGETATVHARVSGQNQVPACVFWVFGEGENPPPPPRPEPSNTPAPAPAPTTPPTAEPRPTTAPIVTPPAPAAAGPSPTPTATAMP